MISSVVEQRLARPFSVFTVMYTQPGMIAPRDVSAEELQSGRLAIRTDMTANAEWDGRVLLLRERSA
ncbi:hypothetical protein [Mesorhizobium captivum]|uniref:hypothetical protein n=1 Tax=Mesorhizobium captivum TaxID=3072319 RepID=UPI002A24B368|nr:hypothetical protein [Mesorhizobium sp. VK3C]MDX8449412.1 hypothetical protein [Mesorhizobium sp. VK3C]